MILDIYKDALEYSYQSLSTLLKLGVLFLLSFLIIPIFLVYGYDYRVTLKAVNGMIGGSDGLPEFTDAIGMLIEGVKVFIVNLIYMLVPFLLFIVIMAIAGNLQGTGAAAVVIIGFIIVFAISIIAYLMSKMAIAHMAVNEGSLSKAFAIKELYEIISSIGWLRVIGTYIGIIVLSVILTNIVYWVIGFIFTALGFSTAVLGAGGYISGGIMGFGMILSVLIMMFIVGPFLHILDARATGLLYNIH